MGLPDRRRMRTGGNPGPRAVVIAPSPPPLNVHANNTASARQRGQADTLTPLIPPAQLALCTILNPAPPNISSLINLVAARHSSGPCIQPPPRIAPWRGVMRPIGSVLAIIA